MLGQLCVQFALPRDDGSLRAYLTGEDPALLELFPEIGTLRDVAFLAKAVTHPSADSLPEVRPWALSEARLTWRCKDEKLVVRGFGGVLGCAAWLDASAAEEEDERGCGAVGMGDSRITTVYTERFKKLF